MTLARAQFADFFGAVRPGQLPFAWQERLLDHLLSTGSWPQRIAAPTGAGKTAVIDVHVFACALMGWGSCRRVPRRLSVVVDRRFVVDSHDEHARHLREVLSRAADGVLLDVATGLSRLRSDGARDVQHRSPASRLPLETVRLRGGTPPPRSWRDDPEGCLVLIATPDMWGSRLLLGGYGSSPRSRPREAGLLAYDSVAVIDEAHLSRQLRTTAGRVGELLACCDEPLPLPALQVVETTATPDERNEQQVGVDEADLASDDHLRMRLVRPKPVTLLPCALPVPAKGRARAQTVAALAEAVTQLHREAGATVGCVVNRVATALDVGAQLKRHGLRVETLVGRLRPADVDAMRHRRPGLFTIEGDPDVDVLVATQTIEVGIDIDLNAMVTELAPGTALAQRAGRVNRLGSRPQGRVVVAIPATAFTERSDVAPYQREDLTAALAWLAEVAGNDDGMSPWRLRALPPPSAAARRTLLQRPELADTWLWSVTGDDLFTEGDRELWLADDLEVDLDVGLVVRADLPDDPAVALPMLRACPPRPYETFTVRIATLRRLRERLTYGGGTASFATWYRWRAGEVDVMDAFEVPRPGDTFIVRDSVPICRGGIVDAEGEAPASDVFETGRPKTGESVSDATVRLGASSTLPADESTAGAAVAALFQETASITEWTLATKRLLANGIADIAPLVAPELAVVLRAAAELLRIGRAADTEIQLLAGAPQDQDGQQAALIVLDRRRAVADEDVRQTWSPAGGVVLLERHQAAVGERAEGSGRALGLTEELVEVLRVAALHHDDGKSDERFQRMLGRTPEWGPLAKSGKRGVREAREALAESGLPTGWRHEQLSILGAQRALVGHEHNELILRLVGTSHGHGRVGFPHTSAGLLTADADQTTRQRAVALFDEGEWDVLVEATDRRYGVWGCAYLEAVLRAADGRVSGEGS